MTRLFWILLATLLASSAAAQTLAGIAKKEKERRANNDEEQTQTITERELRRNLGGPMTTSTAVAATDESSDSADEDDADAEPEQVDPSQTREYWRNRLSGVDGRIQTLQQQLQSPLYTSDPRGASRRDRLEQQLAQAQAERDAIVEEARRAGAPPGWLR